MTPTAFTKRNKQEDHNEDRLRKNRQLSEQSKTAGLRIVDAFDILKRDPISGRQAVFQFFLGNNHIFNGNKISSIFSAVSSADESDISF